MKIRDAVVGAVLMALSNTPAIAQDTNLGAGGAEMVWRGEFAGARAGTWLDQGAVGSGDSRRDLIIGAPGDGTMPGKVFVIFGGPVRTGQLSLSQADAVLSGARNGDRFGAATAAGNIVDPDGSSRRAIVVGAPGASSGRGIVYLFPTGVAQGQSLTTASAVLTVTGAPGDRLGTSLATADIDGDGYREIIMGAPGNNRVYIVYGGEGRSGATTPDITITGTGLGTVLTAGSVTGTVCVNGRQPYDIFLGASTLNLVYMIKGRCERSRPSSMLLSRDEDAYFVGFNGDRAGSSLAIGDLDNDDRQDLFIGAPLGGGSEAGAVYVLWGKPTFTSMSLASADLTMIGPSPGARIGVHISTGDINRDSPNDVSIVGSAPGAGQVIVYYGRSRSSIGAAGANGQVLDFSIPDNISRRIEGDASLAPITGSVIYEVTGEGARDIIVGSPASSSSAGLESGLVYFATSPRLSVRPTNAYVATVQGVSGTGTLTVANGSTVGITWAASSQSPSLVSVSPTSGSAVSGQTASIGLTALGGPLGPGQYTGSVKVASTSPHLEMFATVPVTVAVFSPPSLTANRSFPAQSGVPITWTAQTNAGAMTLSYEFWRFDAGRGWSLVQGYSASNTYTWTPTRADDGMHAVQVRVKTSLSSATYDVYTQTAAFETVTPAPTVTALQSDTPFPAPPGSVVRWTATATGGAAPLQYRFVLYREGSGWTALQEYSSANEVVWTPTQPGSYLVEVWVRSAGATEPYEALRNSGFVQISSTLPLTVAPLTADKPFPAKAGQSITFTGSATGGSAGPLQYKFVRYHEGVGWMVAQEYSSSRTFTWTPGGSDVGQHAVQVWVRSAGSTASYEAWNTTGMFSVTTDPLSTPVLRADAVFPIPANTAVTWTATTTGGVAPLQYEFWVHQEGVGWTIPQPYGPSNVFTWTPSVDGRYAVQARVRNAGSSNEYDAWIGSGVFTIGGSSPAQIASFGADVPLPAAAGTTIVWTAVPTGGTAGPLEYYFVKYNANSGVWSVAQAYSTSNRFTWATTSADVGTYALQVWVRSAGSSAAYEHYATTGFFSIQ